MAKTKISEFDTNPSNNTDIDGINIAEGCAPSGINNAIRELMSQLKEQQTGASGDGFTVAGTLNVTGNLHLDGSAGTSGQVMVSQGSGNTPVWGNAFVAGMIMLWSGSSASIPSGWLLCDGTSGTPDLRNRFVVGAGSTYAVGATGGSADAIVVAHTHTGTTSSNGNHNHYVGSNDSTANDGGAPLQEFVRDWNAGNGPATYTNTTGAHTHTFTTDSTGSSGTNANLPPYYALCYIMKA